MRRLLVVVTGVTLILFFIAVGFGADFQVRTGPDAPVEEMAWLNVAFLTVVVGLLAWGLAALLDRVKSGRVIWTVVALVVMVVSFGLLGPSSTSTSGESFGRVPCTSCSD